MNSNLNIIHILDYYQIISLNVNAGDAGNHSGLRIHQLVKYPEREPSNLGVLHHFVFFPSTLKRAVHF